MLQKEVQILVAIKCLKLIYGIYISEYQSNLKNKSVIPFEFHLHGSSYEKIKVSGGKKTTYRSEISQLLLKKLFQDSLC